MVQVNFYKTKWFQGRPFQWNEVRLNGGDMYHCFRFLKLLIHVRYK